jgi:hypothetical protein
MIPNESAVIPGGSAVIPTPSARNLPESDVIPAGSASMAGHSAAMAGAVGRERFRIAGDRERYARDGNRGRPRWHGRTVVMARPSRPYAIALGRNGARVRP